jgi:hypothetical protein
MDEAAITQYITSMFAEVHTDGAWGDTFFYYNPDRALPDTIYFATLKNADDDYDGFSQLNRPAVFRLNIGVGKATYRALFGGPPPRPGSDADAGGDPGPDFTVLDQLLPHPVYGRQYWVCVLNPSPTTFETVVQPLLAEAHALAVEKYTKHPPRGSSSADQIPPGSNRDPASGDERQADQPAPAQGDDDAGGDRAQAD